MSVMSILKAKHTPELFKKEKEEADALHKERLEFIEGFKALLAAHKANK